MIGDGWDGDPSTRPHDSLRDEIAPTPQGRVRVCVVTGSRAEFGLLRPVMRAIAQHPRLDLKIVAAGAHLVAPAASFHEVKRDFPPPALADIVPMQIAGRFGREEDVESVARGVARCGRVFARMRPTWVLVLGDRIEAFAAGVAASVGGYALAHVHGGDRAEGVADEAMRHAISKLAHVHFAATPASRERLVRMGEPEAQVHIVGSPAIDELAGIAPLSDAAYVALGAPSVVFLMHPTGQPAETEEAIATSVLDGLAQERVLALDPNTDPGREGIASALGARAKSAALGEPFRRMAHLPRSEFVGLLKRLAVRDGGGEKRGVLVGNSSAGLIEAAALKVPVVDVGNRQGGRERCGNAVHVAHAQPEAIVRALAQARSVAAASYTHPYGDGTSGERIARILAGIERPELLLRKRCAY